MYPDKEKDNLFYVYIYGERNSIHQEAIYKLKIELHEDYPNSCPLISFIDPVPFHPNISNWGSICLNKFSKWNKYNYYICDMLDYINFILYNPNPEDPYCSTANDLYIYNQKNYNETCKKKALESKQRNKDQTNLWYTEI